MSWISQSSYAIFFILFCNVQIHWHFFLSFSIFYQIGNLIIDNRPIWNTIGLNALPVFNKHCLLYICWFFFTFILKILCNRCTPNIIAECYTNVWILRGCIYIINDFLEKKKLNKKNECYACQRALISLGLNIECILFITKI